MQSANQINVGSGVMECTEKLLIKQNKNKTLYDKVDIICRMYELKCQYIKCTWMCILERMGVHVLRIFPFTLLQLQYNVHECGP